MIKNQLQERAAAKETDTILVDGKMPYLCFAGAQLIGIALTLKPIVNGAFLLVAEVNPETDSFKDETTDLEFEIFPVQLQDVGPSLSVVYKAGR